MKGKLSAIALALALGAIATATERKPQRKKKDAVRDTERIKAVSNKRAKKAEKRARIAARNAMQPNP